MNKDEVITVIREALLDYHSEGAKLSNGANYIYNCLTQAGYSILKDGSYVTEEILKQAQDAVIPSKLEIEDAIADILVVRAYNWLLKNERSPSNESNRHKAAEDLLVALFSEKFDVG